MKTKTPRLIHVVRGDHCGNNEDRTMTGRERRGQPHGKSDTERLTWLAFMTDWDWGRPLQARLPASQSHSSAAQMF